MGGKPKKQLDEPSAPMWMVSYGDMTTLLLTFFILIVSMSSIEITKFKRALSSLQGDIGVLKHQPSVLKEQNISQMKFRRTQATMEDIQSFQKQMQGMNLGDEVQVELTEKGVHFLLGDPVLFELGSAQLKPQMGAVLDAIAEVVRGRSYDIRVEGHTDNLPIFTEKYPSNWELSSARALAVVKGLMQRGVEPWRLSPVGYGEWRPMFPNDEPKYRAKNRRIEIYATWGQVSAWDKAWESDVVHPSGRVPAPLLSPPKNIEKP